jgi:alpha-tubulin suppressor-like RCC1 family protein
VAAGAVSSCAHSTDDRIFCWGSAERGSVGHGAFEDIVTSPVDVMGGVSVDVGGAHACAVDASGELWCWGANEHGQLGLGDIGVDRSAPERVSALSAVTAVGLGEDHGCALDAIGKLRCWGAGGSGQLGTGEASDTPTPTTVDAEGIFVAFGAGDRHTCAVTDGQQLYCWGANETAQLGIGERGITRGRTSPTLVSDSILFRTATAGSFHTCAPSVLNVLYCWGDNSRAQLGTGDRADRRLPSMIESGLESPSAGSIHGCAVRNIGTLACWGAGDDGRLGLGDETDRLRPTLVDTRRTWLEVSAGDAHTCAVDMVGALYCWGGGGSGQLGVPDLARALRPVRTCLPGPP